MTWNFQLSHGKCEREKEKWARQWNNAECIDNKEMVSLATRVLFGRFLRRVQLGTKYSIKIYFRRKLCKFKCIRTCTANLNVIVESWYLSFVQLRLFYVFWYLVALERPFQSSKERFSVSKGYLCLICDLRIKSIDKSDKVHI